MILKIVLMPAAGGGYTVTAPRLPGCIAEGETHDQALAARCGRVIRLDAGRVVGP